MGHCPSENLTSLQGLLREDGAFVCHTLMCTCGSVSSQSPGATRLRSGISTVSYRRTGLWRRVQSGWGVKADVVSLGPDCEVQLLTYRQGNEGTGLCCVYSPCRSVTYHSKVAGATL